MKKRSTDFSQRALAVVEESTAERTETAEELYRLFCEETGVVAPMQEVHPPLVDEWGGDERWRRWREWIAARKRGDEMKSNPSAAGRKGGLKGGMARAKALSPERRQEIARTAARSRWRKDSGGTE